MNTFRTTALKREEFWRLKVEFWPRAIAAGVRPINSTFGECLTDQQNPARYQSYNFDFNCPPSRGDFAAVVRQTPWMHNWLETLIPVIERNHWPMMDWMHKMSHVDLIEDSKTVGRLTVSKEEMYQNLPYHTAPILSGEIDAAVRGLRKDMQEAARDLIRTHENFLREQYVHLKLWDDEAGRQYVMADLLYRNGLRTSKPKAASFVTHASEGKES